MFCAFVLTLDLRVCCCLKAWLCLLAVCVFWFDWMVLRVWWACLLVGFCWLLVFVALLLVLVLVLLICLF